MSKYFEEVDFPVPPSPAEPPRPVVVWDQEKLNEAFRLITLEIDKIRDGTSSLTTYPINPGSFTIPAINAIRRFVDNPSDKAYKGVHEICRQDFGARAGDAFHKLLRAARTETLNNAESD